MPARTRGLPSSPRQAMTNPDLQAHRSRQQHIINIRDRALRIASIGELFAGFPFQSADWLVDAGIAIDQAIDELGEGEDLLGVVEPLRKLRKNLTKSTVARATKSLAGRADPKLMKRFAIYQACNRGSAEERRQVAAMIAAERFYDADVDSYHRLCTLVGLMIGGAKDSMSGYHDAGASLLADMSDIASALEKSVTEAEGTAADAEPGLAEGLLDAATNDHDEKIAAFISSITGRPLPPRVVVIPELPKAATSHRKEIQRMVEGVAGKALPIVQTGDIVAIRRELDSRFPWAASVTDRILRDLAGGGGVRLQPTLLISDPGQGKSTYAQALLDVLQLPSTMLSMAGAADSSLAGTSAQWSTTRPSDAVQLIARSSKASVGIVLDEIDKIASGNHNGSAADALLPFLEPSTSKSIRDPALEVEVDLSWISWLATANDLDRVPKPLRDRLRVIRMPVPGPEHINVLLKNLIAEISADKREDLRFIAPLAQDEVEILVKAWAGGSLRKLRDITKIMLANRDEQMGRC
jgi:ATP-dependent Lon protease, bacterial type